MTGYIKKPHTAIFIGQTGCGKSHLVLELIEKQCNNHFYYIVIICPTLRENDTYHSKEWIKKNDSVWLADPRDNLYQWIKKLPKLLRFLEVLFIIDDIIANEALDKKKQAQNSEKMIPTILKSGSKKKNDSVWLADPRDNLYQWIKKASNFLRKSKHASLYIPNEFPRGFRLLNHV